MSLKRTTHFELQHKFVSWTVISKHEVLKHAIVEKQWWLKHWCELLRKGFPQRILKVVTVTTVVR